MDTTERILTELKLMLAQEEIEENLIKEVESLIEGVNNQTINLFDYRRSTSRERHGDALISLILEANERQRQKKRENT